MPQRSGYFFGTAESAFAGASAFLGHEQSDRLASPLHAQHAGFLSPHAAFLPSHVELDAQPPNTCGRP